MFIVLFFFFYRNGCGQNTNMQAITKYFTVVNEIVDKKLVTSTVGSAKMLLIAI